MQENTSGCFFLNSVYMTSEQIHMFKPIKSRIAGKSYSSLSKQMFDAHKTRMIALLCGKGTYDNILSRFDKILECDGQTDRQNCYINTVLTCDKNHCLNHLLRGVFL